MCKWECIRCGQCCGVVPFDKEDVEKLDTTVQFEEQCISGHLFYVPKSALKTGKCPFYNRKKKGRAEWFGAALYLYFTAYIFIKWRGQVWIGYWRFMKTDHKCVVILGMEHTLV